MARITNSLFCLPLNPTAAVNKEEALVLRFAWSLPRILPVVQAGPWHPPEHILQPSSTQGIHTIDSISCLAPQDLLQLHTLASSPSLLDLRSD
ncbi:hypothetical protein CY35_17G067200 [Sphagnum magellanicum]|nr:hypothetical protein CY35_17G067200 [Sphagnum magellanicum]